MSKEAVKRIINKDIKIINKMKINELGIHIHFNEENLLEAKAIIIGPKNTPYENGLLFFIINFPNDYPFNPPKIHFYSSCPQRMHPNLYVGKSHNNFLGKVCLSSINTWSGPKWTPAMHIGSILLSIQSLLCENPLHNEPGFENEKGNRNKFYNISVEYNNFNYNIIKNAFHTPEKFTVFSEIIKKHINENKNEILNKLEKLCQMYKTVQKISVNIYNISLCIDYPNTKKKFIDNI